MRPLALAALLVIAGCHAVPASPDTTDRPSASTSPPHTTTIAEPTATTQESRPHGGQFVRLDPVTLETLSEFDPIPFPADSWSVLFANESLALNFEWNPVAERIAAAWLIDLENWRPLRELDLDGYTAGVFHDGQLFTLDNSGALSVTDLATGETEKVEAWTGRRWAWNDLRVVSGGRIAALLTDEGGSDDSVRIYDSTTGTATDIPVGMVVRANAESGVFDGGYQIPETNLPGVVWSNERVFMVYAGEMEIVEVDLLDGTVNRRSLDTASWWERFVGNWVPAATAKGPTLGVHSSAALSADDRYLFISGNRTTVETGADGVLVETSEHLGLTVVDLETWSALDVPDLAVQYVRSDGGRVLAVDTVSLEPWRDELYVLDVGPDRALVVLGPFGIRSGGCQLTGGGDHLICTEHGHDSTHLRTIAVETGQTVAERTVSSADYIHPNGVLEDWPPFDD